MRTDLFLFLTLTLAAITSCDEASGDRYDPSTYKNPVTTQKMPDPTVIRDGDRSIFMRRRPSATCRS